MAKKVKFSYRKYNGDDQYSWAVFRSDKKSPIIAGETRDQAKWIKEQCEKEQKELNSN